MGGRCLAATENPEHHVPHRYNCQASGYQGQRAVRKGGAGFVAAIGQDGTEEGKLQRPGKETTGNDPT